MTGKIYVTTTIPYVNARPHVGFALELVQADAIARYHRLIGHQTRLQTGTDENAFKNVLAARELGISTQELVDRNAEAYRAAGRALRVSADEFIRTTQARHRQGVHAFWRRLRPEDVYRTAYRGLYCTGCEDFYLEKDLVNGRCPDHDTVPVEVEEENYFFRLSRYQKAVEELLAADRIRVTPAKRRNEVLSFVRGGLKDFSISRDARRAGGWGIGVPGDESQVIYVWVDALINYLTGLGLGGGDGWRDWWNERTVKVHVIGKNVWKFHAVYWPALLLSAGLAPPDEIVVHGFLTAEGRKISKSLGNAIDPVAYVDRFGADPLRYYLLRAVSPFDDGDFSEGRLKHLYNVDLANGLGNLLSRLASLCRRAGFGRHAAPAAPPAPGGYAEALGRYEFDRALESLWRVVAAVNRDIDRHRPWELLKEKTPGPLRERLRRWLDELYRVAYWLLPLLPDASGRILEALSGDEVQDGGPLFPRVGYRARFAPLIAARRPAAYDGP